MKFHFPFHPNQNVILDLSGISIVEHHWQQRIKPITTQSEKSLPTGKGRSIHEWRWEWLCLYQELTFSSYSGCWHLKPQLSSSSWDARGFWESCRWDRLPASWPTSSPSSTACRVSSSSWCTASSASRYHYLTPPQDSPNPHSSLWADPEHDLLLQVQKQYKIRFKGIKKTKAESEEYTLSSRAISEPSKHSEVRSCTVPQSTSLTDQLSSTCLSHWTTGYKVGDTLLWLTVVYI